MADAGRKTGHQGRVGGGGGERQGTGSASRLFTHNKCLHNRLVNITFLLHWFPKGLTAPLLRDYFQGPVSGRLPQPYPGLRFV